MARTPGLSVRLTSTLSYAAFLMLASTLLLGAVWLFLLRYVPDRATLLNAEEGQEMAGPFPIRSKLLEVFAPRAAGVMAFLLVFGLVGGWFLAGRMLAPLTRITEAIRIAATGSPSRRVELEGRSDEFREPADAFDRMLARLEAHIEEQRRSPPTPPTSSAHLWRSPRPCSRWPARTRTRTSASCSIASTR